MRRDSGQLTILIIGCALIAILAVGVVVNASSAFLMRRSLASWADGAVLAAAQSVDHHSVYGQGVNETLPLSTEAARAAVSAYVVRNGLAERFDDFRVTHVGIDPGTGRVTVRLAASMPLVLIGEAVTTPVTADASAISRVTG